MAKILVIDDEKNLRRILKDYLENEGNEVLEAPGGEEGIKLALSTLDLDLILLDIRMPGMDGFEVMEELKGRIQVPVIFLTALGDNFNEIKGLNLGADDYIAKPFNYKVLMARINAILRKNKSEDLLTYGTLKIDRVKHLVSIKDLPCELTVKEFELLNYLVENFGQSMDRSVLLDRIWGYDYEGDQRTVDTHVKTLRAKLHEAGNMIKTVRGVGYRFEEI